MSLNRHRVLRYMTNRPNEVVYKDDIMAELDLKAQQVTASVLGLQGDTSIGSQIHTLIRGNAWRYVPTDPRTVSTAGLPDLAPYRSRPLTQLIREYLTARPNQVVYRDELVAYTGKTSYQVQVGVNNMRRGQPDMMQAVETIIDGQSWVYREPIPTSHRRTTASPTPAGGNERRSSATTAPAARPPETTPKPTSAVDDSDGEPRLFEEVGRTASGIVIRDADGVMYRATPL